MYAALPMRESRAILDEGLNWNSPESAITLLRRIKEAGFNVFMPCVWHGRGTVWPSKLAPWEASYHGYDPLGYLVQAAPIYDIEVHPWFTVMHRERNFLQQYYDPGTPDESFEVHNVKFREFISSLVLEVVQKYPVQGINLDFVRTGGVSTSVRCRDEYKRRTGRHLLLDFAAARIEGQLGESGPQSLVSWQEAAVRDVIYRISTGARAINKQIVVSVDAAPWHPTIKLEGQDSIGWADDGLVDVVYSMNYEYHPDFRKLAQIQSRMTRPEALVILCGNYDVVGSQKTVVPRDPNRVDELLAESRAFSRGNGVGLYLYSMLSDAQIMTLKTGVFKYPAIPAWRRAS